MTTSSETKVYIDAKEFLIHNVNIEKGKVDFNKSIEVVSEIKQKTEEYLDNLLKSNPEFLNVPEKKKNEEEEDEN